MGIPEDRLKDVFNMFTQIEAHSTHTKGGLGIGLTYAKKIIDINFVKKGGYVGYQDFYLVKEDSYVATIPIGYADGIPYDIGNTNVTINGHKCAIIGKVCMDMFMVDISSLVRNEIGDPKNLINNFVEIIGVDTTPLDFIEISNTNIYVFFSMLSNRLGRLYYL